MKFLLLKTLLLRKKTDEGFTLPIVIAIGLVMVLLSAVDLVQSGEENLNALSQRGTADALAVAEIGVARYRALLNSNRILAINDSDKWITTDTDTTIDDQVCTAGIFGDGGWADTSSSTGWRNFVASGNAMGSYRLIEYEYDQNPLDNNNDDDNDFDQFDDANNDFDGDGESDARGFLTIQGRDTTGSVAQIQVEIPIGVNTQELDNLSPALWIEQDSITNAGNIDINSDGTESDGTRLFSEPDDGNIVLYRPAAATSTASDPDGCDNPADLSDETTISDSRKLPPVLATADIASVNKRTINGDISTEGASATAPSNEFNTTTKKIVLGTTLDDSGAEQALNEVNVNGQNQKRYYYTTGTSNLSIEDGETIVADGVSRVILHIGGNLNLDTGTGGTVRLVNSQHSSQAANGVTRSGIARYLEIHVEGDLIIQGSGTVDITGLVRVGGEVDIQGNSTVNVIGSLWTNDWNANNGTLNIDTDQYTDTTVSPAQTTDEYQFYSITLDRTKAPRTYRPTQWQRQEADS